MITPHPATIITTQPPSPPSSPPNQHHQGKPTHSIWNPFITHPTRNPIKPNHHPPNRRQDHQNPPMNQKKTSRSRSKPTDPHPQSTKKPEKKKLATNKSERDWHLQLEQDRRLAAPPPPCDGRRHALHPRFWVPPPHPVCSWRDLTWSELIFLWMIGEFMDKRINEIRKEKY